MFNDTSSPLSLLATRRSGKPRDLVAPGPDADQLAQILAIAARTPDHGKLAPWRFVVVGQDQRTTLAALIIDAYRVERPTASRTEIMPRSTSAKLVDSGESPIRSPPGSR